MWLMISAACLAVLLILFLYWQDNGLTVSALEYKNKMLPPAFDGLRAL